MTMRVYVGTYAKYSNGSLAGAWLDLEDYADTTEFLAACSELHTDEDDPEFMFQDWEGIPGTLITESSIAPEVWEVLEAMDDYEPGAVDAYISIFGEWDKQSFEERYRGYFDSWEAMAEEFLEETGGLAGIPEHLRSYFDYKKYANDIRLSGDMREEGDYFFWKR